MARKDRYWEPPYVQVPINFLQRIVKEVVADVLAGIPPGSGPSATTNAQVIVLLNNVKDIVMSLSAQVQTLVDQVAASKSIEASSAAAMVQLVTQSKANADQIVALTAAAGAAGMSAEDAAAIAKSATDLHDSAVALQAAVPASVPPAATPAPVIPPAA